MTDGQVTGVVEQLLNMSYEGRVANPCIGAERADLVYSSKFGYDWKNNEERRPGHRWYPEERAGSAAQGPREGQPDR